MNALKKRPVALTITVVLVLLSILLGSHRSLAKERGQVEALLETGTGEDGSILADRQEQMKICANLASVAERYLPDGVAEELRETAQKALEKPMGVEYNNARELADKAIAALEQEPSLRTQDEDYLTSFRSQLDSYDMIIARNGYNEMARAFNEKTLGGFPASVLGPLTGIDPLEVYE